MSLKFANVTRRRTCRVCDGGRLQLLFSLGEAPLAGELVTAREVGQPQARYPLDVHMCLDCAHVQLLDLVDLGGPVACSPDGWLPGDEGQAKQYLDDLAGHQRLARGDLVVKLGGEVCPVLRGFEARGQRVLAIGPDGDRSRAPDGEPRLHTAGAGGGAPPRMLTPALAGRLREAHGPARLIAGLDVLTSAGDLHALLDGVSTLLSNDGAVVFEMPYLLDVVEQTLFDTIHHAHLSYHSMKPLVTLFGRHGLEPADAWRTGPEAAYLRVLARRRPAHGTRPRAIEALVGEEADRGLHQPGGLQMFFDSIQVRKREVRSVLDSFLSAGKRVAGFGAAAPATTLMHQFELGRDALAYVADEDPRRQGLFTPGTHIPIVPPTRLSDDPPDCVLVLAWHSADAIRRTHGPLLTRPASFLVPLPRVELVRAAPSSLTSNAPEPLT